MADKIQYSMYFDFQIEIDLDDIDHEHIRRAIARSIGLDSGQVMNFAIKKERAIPIVPFHDS